MHGNVFELCQDDWHENYENAPNDGSAWVSEESTLKVVRGGSWRSDPYDSSSTYRGNVSLGYRSDNIGFRVVCVAPRTT